MSRHLVAPELIGPLDSFPAMGPITAGNLMERRARGLAVPPPQLSADERAVRMRAVMVPGSGDAPDVRVVLYEPAVPPAAPVPAFLHIHGGGYVAGTVEFGDAAHRARVARLGCVVATVDYRLAPETPFPGALEDCYAALAWLHAEAATLRIDPARIAIGGESAGGGHAAALAILARDRGEVPVCFQLLDSPMLDDRTGSDDDAEPHPHTGAYVWVPGSNRSGWSALLGCAAGGPDVPAHAVPARVDNLSRLPPAFIVVGTLDLFVEEDMDYARRLIRAGVPCELHLIPGAFHGFIGLAPASPQAAMQRHLADAALARAWGVALPG